MIDPLEASYEAVPYESKPISATEVGLLEAMALLYGLEAPPADTARVLELGCASGGNLIPMAYRYPNSRFVGIDLTPGQIAVGKQEIAVLGLENITLDAMSIADIADDFGVFDYIICHGVYSWVPAEVQDAILRVCARNLSPTGVAYVSYNTLPGWHVRGMVREMVMYHDDPSQPPRERVARANDFVDLLVSQGGSPPSLHAHSLAQEGAILKGQGLAHFIHEQLEPYNFPVYFAEFARRASAHGLRFLAEAKLADTTSAPPEWAERAAGDGDVVRAHQYLDFATGRAFRRTLLCHENVVPLARPNPDAVAALHLVLRAVQTAPAEEDAAKDPRAEAFKSPEGSAMTTNNPVVLAAFHALSRVAPGLLPFGELVQRVNDRLSVDEPGAEPSPERVSILAGAMLQCAIGGFIEFNRYPTHFATKVSERPVASRLARAKPPTVERVPNLRHYSVQVSGLERVILMELDGSHDRAYVVDRVMAAIEDGRLAPDGETPDRQALIGIVDEVLARLANVALLEA